MTPNCLDCYHVGETVCDGSTVCHHPGQTPSGAVINWCEANRLADAEYAEAVGVCGQQGRFFEPLLELPPVQITREVAHA